MLASPLRPAAEDVATMRPTAGSTFALILWLIASLLFSFYVGNFGHYNKVFGSLASIAVFLIWLYISNIAVLLGLELDNELARFKKKYGYGAFSHQRFSRDQEDELPPR